MEEWIKIIHVESIDSTNEYATGIRKETGMPFVVYTDFQTGGKGQGMNTWESKRAQNLLASAVISPEGLTAVKNFFISKITALAVLETLSEYVKQLVIKWPNDILCEGRKICGILIENTLMGENVISTIIGTGINLNQTAFGEMNLQPTSLKLETGKEFIIGEILNEYLDSLKYYLEMLNRGEYDTIDHEYFSQLLNYKKWAEFRTGQQKFQAMIVDVMDDGYLILKCRNGQFRKFGFGEISLINSSS